MVWIPSHPPSRLGTSDMESVAGCLFHASREDVDPPAPPWDYEVASGVRDALEGSQ